MERTYVYILASDSHQLYVGVTNDLCRRLAEHRTEVDPSSYAVRHETVRLVYCESTDDVLAALRREKQIKSWTRRKRLALIERANPHWQDLTDDS
jgi:putative endonuclease